MARRRYLILGGKGQLATAFARRLGQEALALGRADVDLTRGDTIRAALDVAEAEVVLNCASYNQVDRAESEPAAAFAVNAIGVGELARLCQERDCTLVHYSTDYVFGADESRRTPYRETDPPRPLNRYGESKLAGERQVQTLCARHFVLRTCGLYGEGEGHFVARMLRLAREGKPVRVVRDQICTPTWTNDLVEATLVLLASGKVGLYHVTNSGQCARDEFTRAAFAHAGIDAPVESVTMAELGAPARRPQYSVLDTEAYKTIAGAPLPSWRDALACFLSSRPDCG